MVKKIWAHGCLFEFKLKTIRKLFQKQLVDTLFVPLICIYLLCNIQKDENEKNQKIRKARKKKRKMF